MKRFKNWLKAKLRHWLEIDELAREVTKLNQVMADLVNIGVDVHFKEPHMILIYSRLNGGQIREVRADFKDMRELMEFVREMKARFNTRSEIWDAPQMVQQMRRDWGY